MISLFPFKGDIGPPGTAGIPGLQGEPGDPGFCPVEIVSILTDGKWLQTQERTVSSTIQYEKYLGSFCSNTESKSVGPYTGTLERTG
jgi:hypothetical protein